ncbi:unnamed protein product [Tilletia caries]|nr:unnamed protein product [Tilletia caries]
MAAAEFGALLLADFDHRLDLQNANRLRPSPHPFGARNPGPFGGGPQAVIPAHARTRDLPAPSHFTLHVMAGGIDSLESHDRPVASTSASASNAAAAAVPGAPDFKPASSTISAHHRAAFAESSTMAQKRRLLEDSAGLECSFMGVGTGTGPWDAGSEETARRVATLQARLQQRLGPEYVSSRAGPSGGPKVSYIEGWKAIDLANDVFGFNGWSSSIVNIDVDYLEEHPETGRVNVGVSVTVRVTLRDGTFHEDVGYGSMDNSKSRAAALEKSKKEAVTDALKRTLRTFGRVLGNCLYDKQFLRDVSKVSLPPVKFDPSTLHRRPEFAQAAAGKKPPTTTSEHAEPATTGASASSSTTMPPPPIPAPAPALVRTATAPAPRSVAPNTTSRANAVSDQAQTASPSKPASNPALVRSRTMGPGPVSANSTVLAPRTAGPSVPAGNASVPSDKSHSAQTSVREATSTSTSQAGAEAAAAIAAAATMSAADKARLAEQRRMEAQKRLARTKSMHAGVVGANTTTESAAHTSSVGGAAGTSPAKSALVPGRIEVPTFGPQLGRVSKAESAGAGRASPMNSTPFGPRFVQKSKYPDDSAVFFPDDDDHGEEEEGEQSMEGGGGGSGKKRMLLQKNHGAAMGAGEDGLGEGGGADRSHPYS